MLHTNMYSTDMHIETPPQSSVSVLTAGISGGVVGSLIFIALAFATGFGLGRCVHFCKKSKQTPAGTLISHYCINIIYVLIIIMSVCDCSLRTYKYKYL